MAFCGKDIAVLQRPISDVVYIHLRAFSGYPAMSVPDRARHIGTI